MAKPLYVYTGSQWVPVASELESTSQYATTTYVDNKVGLDFIRSDSFSGVSSVSFGSDANPVFTSNYDNYKIIIEGVGSLTSDQNINFRLRANTTDLTTSSYTWQQLTADNTTLAGSRNSGQTSYRLGSVDSLGNEKSSIILDITAPALTRQKNIQSYNQYVQTGAGPRIGLFFGYIESASSYNGFTIFASTNIDGYITVYGYKK